MSFDDFPIDSTGTLGDLAFIDYADLIPALQKDLQLNLGTDVQANTFPDVSGLLVWQTPTLLNSWANLGSGFETAAYLKDPLGFVHIKGVIIGGATGTVAFVLPAGYRPGATTDGPLFGGSATGNYQIASNGNVTIVGTFASGVGLSGITFLAEK